MNKNLILKSNILDIVFENRNKAYGAYILRKFYPNRIKIAVGLMFVIAAVFATLTLIPKAQQLVHTIQFDMNEPELGKAEFPLLVPEKKQEPEKQAAKSDAKEIPVKEQEYTNNISIVDKKEKTNIIQILVDDARIGTNTNLNAEAPPVVKPVKTDAETGTGVAAAPKLDRTSPLDLDAVDIKPTFPGGEEALIKFLKKNLENPYDLENGETISVRVKFVVGYDGKLQKFMIIQDGGDIYNKEVIRVLKKMPDWTPGKAKGETVAVYFTIPVKFTMSN